MTVGDKVRVLAGKDSGTYETIKAYSTDGTYYSAYNSCKCDGCRSAVVSGVLRLVMMPDTSYGWLNASILSYACGTTVIVANICGALHRMVKYSSTDLAMSHLIEEDDII